MEIVCIDKQTFDELRVRFGKLEEKVMGMCRPVEDLGLKKWLDNQEVCEILRISKKTLQVYRDKGILPYSRIKHKIFFKTEDVHKLFPDGRGTIQNSEGQQTDIAGIPHTWCCPLLSGTGQGSLQGIGHP